MSDVKNMPTTQVSTQIISDKRTLDSLGLKNESAYLEKIEEAPASLYQVANYCNYMKHNTQDKDMLDGNSGSASRRFAIALVDAIGGINNLSNDKHPNTAFTGSEELTAENKLGVLQFFADNKQDVIALLDDLIINNYDCHWLKFVNDVAKKRLHGDQASTALDNIKMDKDGLDSDKEQLRAVMISNILLGVLEDVKSKLIFMCDINNVKARIETKK